MRKLLLALVATVALAGMARPVAAQQYKVIVNAANSVAELSAVALTKVMLKQSPRFANGVDATPVYQGKATDVRTAFDKGALGKTVAAIETYWQQQIFSGRDVPPPTKANDDDVVAFVKANPGAIGYVSLACLTTGVKVVMIK